MEDLDTIKINPVLVAKIQSFMNDPIYMETIESAAAFNARLSADRTSRLPFLDSQTGVAQNHSMLWMDARDRLPGLREGQIYTYPSKRWKKKRRQYLNNFMQPRYPHCLIVKETPDESEPAVTPEVPSGNTATPGIIVEEPKEIPPKEEPKPAAWYYDDLDLPDSGEFDEPDADSDYDYEESFSKKKKKKATTPKAPRSNTRGKRKITYDAVTDPEKPFSCDICGARYKTRPGLTYHYTHSHKDKEEEDDDEMKQRDEGSPVRRHGGAPRSSNSSGSSIQPPILHPQQQHPMQLQPPTLQPQQAPHLMGGMGMGMPGPHPGMMIPPHHMPHPHQLHPPPPHLIPQQPPPHVMQHQNMAGRGSPPHPPMMGMTSSSPVPPMPGPSSRSAEQGPMQEDGNKKGQGQGVGEGQGHKPRVQPSLYCDFCLGDAGENKKSGAPEELVSCSDCGRSGHPSCLQFTVNMIISVKKYRWQCIECKCCSICGTSDNDDQLLFCDDCDRGYHMYCLTPPLDAPPEGSWSCSLCIAEFHQGK